MRLEGSPRRLFWLAAATGGTLALAGAWARAWVCDDAFISFRYALNLVRGLGLVFNAGERVEGYSNLLWTLLMAAGLKLGVDLEAWSVAWGLAFFAGTLALLAYASRRLATTVPEWTLPVPAALLVAAVHVDWAIHATSGLETSSYTFLVLAGYLAVTDGRPRGDVAAGLLWGLAALTRPDGILFAGLGGGLVLLAGKPRLAALARYAGPFLLVWAPATAWRVLYYGDYFPNTYYAKSASIAWYSQGFAYVSLYFVKYWVLLLGFAAFLLVLARESRAPALAAGRKSAVRAHAFAAVLVCAYVAYVARVGGDFMYARMLVPVTPLLLLLGEFALAALLPGRRTAQAVLTAAAALGVALTPPPVSGVRWVRGVADEWDYYTHVRRGWREEGRRDGAVLRKYFAGLPVGVAFLGAEACLVYYADPAVAVESETGLTDAVVGRQPLLARGRVGHEKHASARYLLDARKVLLSFAPEAGTKLGLDALIPYVSISFDGVRGRLLRWDPALLGPLRARGAVFPDLPAEIDRYLARSSAIPPERLAADYARLRRFYFSQVDDPEREARFRSALPAAGAGTPR